MMKQKISAKIANLLLSALGILLFVCADPALSAAQSALKLCAESVIPSLFPYMVLSGLIVRRGLLSPLYPLIPMKTMFRLPPAASCPVLLGAVCGFPLGAKTAADLYRLGELTKEEAERTCAIANLSGPAFVVGVIGAIFWKSPRFGWYLYMAQLLSALTAGLLFCRTKTASPQSDKNVLPPKTFPYTESPLRAFADSLSSAASAVIPLCGYIVFFSILCAMIRTLFSDGFLCAVLCSVLEFTSGIRSASSLGGLWGRFLTGFSLGFSGLSVFVQSYCFVSPLGLSLHKTFLVKVVQGVLCGILCTLFPLFFQ